MTNTFRGLGIGFHCLIPDFFGQISINICAIIYMIKHRRNIVTYVYNDIIL